MSASVPITWNDDVNKVEGHLDDLAKWQRPDLAPGSACWVDGMDGQIACLRFVCPCGCGGMGTVPVRPGYGGACWTWDGNKELPTLTPSILRLSDCRWHGFLTKGVFVSC